MNLARMGCLLVFGSEGDEAITRGTVVYFIIAAVIVSSCIFMHMKFVKTKFFKYHMTLAKQDEQTDLLEEHDDTAFEDEEPETP